MNTKTKIGAGLLAIALVLVLLTEGVLIQKQLQPNVISLRFKEYRDGAQLTAVFEMGNQSGSPVVVWETATLIAHRQAQQEDQPITIQRTIIPKDQSAILSVPVPRDCPWQMQFRVARFGPREKREFESGDSVQGTIVYSDVLPQYEPRP